MSLVGSYSTPIVIGSKVRIVFIEIQHKGNRLYFCYNPRNLLDPKPSTGHEYGYFTHGGGITELITPMFSLPIPLLLGNLLEII